MKYFAYSGEKTKNISFPLGGIGSGCIGLAGNGQLVDVEIFGKPNKGSHASFTHFAVKAEQDGKLLDARVIVSDIMESYMGVHNRPHFNSYGFGPDRATLMGIPHFKSCEFQGEFPIAQLRFLEEKFPGTVMMTAFNPFIPLNDKDSSIPAAFFQINLTNTQNRTIDYSVALTATNFYTKKGGMHSFYENAGAKCIHMQNSVYDENDVRFGDMSISTDADDVSCQQYWYRGGWFDNLATFWNDFRMPGHLKNRIYDSELHVSDPNYAADDMATLMARVRLAPGESAPLRFVLSWNTPGNRNYWNPADCDCTSGCCEEESYAREWKNYYATIFKDSLESGVYAVKQFDRLYNETLLFKETLFSSSLPEEALDAVSSNLAILKSPTCLRLEDGSLYGFEGCHCDSGCCEGSCTHVWSYAYSIPFLFPKLERSMRKLEYLYSMHPNGGMAFRLMLPVGRDASAFRPCVDGQYGTVMRVLREYKISGDITWLKDIWPQVKKTIEFAWNPDNADKWDPEQSGIITGRQHHTLDMELFGENAWLSGMYLGGLKAGAELARAVDEEKTASLYETIFEKGRAYLNDKLFNGEYFIQHVDLKDKAQLEAFKDAGKSMNNLDVYSAYWNDEHDEMMYQIGEGCGIDQVLAQWHADIIGLGDIFEPEKTKAALQAIFKHNFIPNMREHFNPCRLYCLNDEGGLTICKWPDGRKKPFIPIPYAEEVMNGFEYQAACHMIARGMVDEGMTCIRALRKRYNGEKRNPWNEFECGSNYARSMASYALLLVFSGFKYDMPRGMIGFAPIENLDSFRCFWSLEGAWGRVKYKSDTVTVQILSGELTIRLLQIEKAGKIPEKVSIDGVEHSFSYEDDKVRLTSEAIAKSEITLFY